MKCDYCKGTGYPFDAKRKWKCGECGGTGTIPDEAEVTAETNPLLKPPFNRPAFTLQPAVEHVDHARIYTLKKLIQAAQKELQHLEREIEETLFPKGLEQ